MPGTPPTPCRSRMTERRAANVCQCGHVFGRLVEVHSASGLVQLLELEGGLRLFRLVAICPKCGRRFYWRVIGEKD